ncbi:MAG: glycosyltransferase [Nitrospinaceae bacterium]|nr:glycosyltransferase [Nitrospinaceae bacterium]NIR56088.1 glycosyltransferase [Nitrospinaceae bacterium]NIS86536.1 glycosyltransferase [Nitrospinaceae bacterium]NIT83370.1 glycosyltransferase [Nitrospinaceae bacterium]NIU45580.1 glycosyltransferase [Nitrospinaceae bacterium]
MKSPKKVLTIYYKIKPDGFCKRYRLMIDAFLDKGCEVHYIAVDPYPFQHDRLIPHILPTPMRSRENLFFWSYFFTLSPLYLLWLCLRYRVDLISVGSPLYACLSGLAKWICRRPLVTFIFITPNSVAQWRFDSTLYEKIETFMETLGLKWSDLLLANSWGAQSAWNKVYPEIPIEVFPNNVEEHAFNKQERRQRVLREFSLQEDRFLISCSGVLLKRKNHDCLIRAMGHLKNSRAVLLIMGQGPRHDELLALARELGVGDRVILAGFRKDVTELVQGTDLFAFPSYAEGMAESLLEASTCQVPCLVSAIPENMDVISNPEQHFPPDDSELLAAQIDRCVEDEEYYRELLAATQKDKERFIFDWKGRFYEKVVSFMKNGR